MDYLSIQDMATKWNIGKRRIQILCKEGRISGAKVIGNMWVIPENTEKPRDARTKNPIPTEKKGYSAMRVELKKALKNMYKRCGDIQVDENDKKSYILSILASNLCFLYLDDKNQNQSEVYKLIYNNISGHKSFYDIDEETVSIAKNYIEKYKNDAEIDNVLSWAYQYSNKIMLPSNYNKTQFFTEKYMIKYLIKNIPSIESANKILDPCSGGGNFLVECLDFLCTNTQKKNIESKVIETSKRLYGYDIDSEIARLSVVNIRLKALMILSEFKENISFDLWNKISPNIFCPVEKDTVAGSLAKDNRLIKNVSTGKLLKQNHILNNAAVIITNPPFASVKGMQENQKDFLKKFYPLANCDTCVSFIDAVYEMLSSDGICGIVSQNSWMHLKSFEKVREKFTSNYTFYNITNLGSGAFIDLSGEKSNVSLLILKKGFSKQENCTVTIQNLSADSLSNKIKKIGKNTNRFTIRQNELNGENGFVLSNNDMNKLENLADRLYYSVAIPMQGTSTGNSKEFVDFFWKHFGEEDWIPVSNGGGYCRWEGLNNCVVKWGKNGEYIKNQKGSALRNTQYFGKTQLVFSDTGTAGLNVRLLLNNQIFIASGPGIRIIRGNEYAHMAFLNSRFAANYIKTISPKLTIAAGYIGRIPVKETLFTSAILERNAKLCVDLKCNHLKQRPNNLEYINEKTESAFTDINKIAWNLLKNDLTNELLKLEIESQCDDYILNEYAFSKAEANYLDKQVGTCAFNIKGTQTIDLLKFDNYLANLLDDSCMLKRVRVSKNSLGCDGILEFIAKDLQINPASIVEQVSLNPYILKNTLVKYSNLILHNRILDLLEYNVTTGINKKSINTEKIIKNIKHSFGLNIDFETWLSQKFNTVHTGIFIGKPFLMYEDGEIKAYDK